MSARLFAVLVPALWLACAPRGGDLWVAPAQPPAAPPSPGWKTARYVEPRGDEDAPPAPPPALGEEEGEPVMIRDHGSARGAKRSDAGEIPRGLFRNTYYDFPLEGPGEKTATIFDASCKPIEAVTREFHDQVCVQGSGRLSSGTTVSFAKRDCACASVCPRTAQRICFERLDPGKFPYGRGATGRPITPLRSIAVDSSVVPLGSVVYIPELAGIPRPDGTPHDGCFVAEDRGLRVIGKQVDVFTGNPALTAKLNKLVPSNSGVHVLPGAGRCGR